MDTIAVLKQVLDSSAQLSASGLAVFGGTVAAILGTSYPFKPNPPCFGSCVGKLASAPHSDLTSVKGLDPGVAVSIKVLAANPQKATIDFTQMRSKSDLEQAADRSFRGNELRFEPSRNKYQMQR